MENKIDMTNNVIDGINMKLIVDMSKIETHLYGYFKWRLKLSKFLLALACRCVRTDLEFEFAFDTEKKGQI